ncbi:hypothetical protein WJX74_001432 [Apatococcus lobatus]|uniref:Uncharacterized protein n=1 Tax=Apatococcus lobatus TaxID=904363 RepID=A0AAW1QHU6_9CHLO
MGANKERVTAKALTTHPHPKPQAQERGGVLRPLLKPLRAADGGSLYPGSDWRQSEAQLYGGCCCDDSEKTGYDIPFEALSRLPALA